MKTAEEIMSEISTGAGWNTSSQLLLTLRFLNTLDRKVSVDESVLDNYEEFLRQIAVFEAGK